ncbi:glycosyltransferase family 2 protein [Novipirellula sp. SH528]|uniref:glycosyltransferase family 2 protein n=1 Tax=Novipirellula sp. SH528 TaxID=3454466 RepID=UPI003FA017F2
MTLPYELINTILWAMAISIAIPSIVFGGECLLGSLCSPTRCDGERVPNPANTGDGNSRPAVDVIIPAHNEQLGLVITLDSVISSLRCGDRIYLVADNCTDDTTAIANRYAADLQSRNAAVTMTVLERFDDEHRGKDYALRHAFDVLGKSSESDRVVVIVDADCKVRPDTIDRLAIQVARTQRPAQACYLMQQPESIPTTAPRMLSEFAFTVKNFVRPLGLSRIGGGCTLFGSGMAFPWQSLQRLSGPGGHLVEDMRWTFDMILARSPVQFCPDAICLATFPTNPSAADTQRRRWEHGHLQLVFSQIPRLLRGWLHRPTLVCFLAAFDLLVLPLSLLMITSTLIGTILLIAALMGYAIGPLVTWAVAMGIAVMGLSVAWSRFCPQRATLRMLFAIPFYAARKLPLYASFVFRPERTWIRTDRN